MFKFIPYFPLNLILFLHLFLSFSTQSYAKKLSLHKLENTEFVLLSKKNKKIYIKLAISNKSKTKGLSAIKSKDFKSNQGLLFVYKKMLPRSFWMPNTFFDLDIIFLDQNLKILKIIKNAKAHPGYKTPPPIYQTPKIYSQYVLEVKSNTFKLKVNEKLKWISKNVSLFEIKRYIHLLQ